jgi:hypothetical protein
MEQVMELFDCRRWGVAKAIVTRAGINRKGNCWVNPAKASFYYWLKTEWVVFEDFRTLSEARRSPFNCITNSDHRIHVTSAKQSKGRPYRYRDM